MLSYMQEDLKSGSSTISKATHENSVATVRERRDKMKQNNNIDISIHLTFLWGKLFVPTPTTFNKAGIPVEVSYSKKFIFMSQAVLVSQLSKTRN
jgi:hypothetical protein